MPHLQLPVGAEAVGREAERERTAVQRCPLKHIITENISWTLGPYSKNSINKFLAKYSIFIIGSIFCISECISLFRCSCF